MPLPAERPAPDDTAPRGSRYDDLVAMYGAKFMAEKVADARTFVVGCGALGCEYLKNFALLGVGTGPRGQIVVTDNDRIEVSNLNRQFLFREKNVGQPKSVAASQAALRMNGALKIEAKEELVSEIVGKLLEVRRRWLLLCGSASDHRHTAPC